MSYVDDFKDAQLRQRQARFTAINPTLERGARLLSEALAISVTPDELLEN